MLKAGGPLWVLVIVDMVVEEMIDPSRELHQHDLRRSLPPDTQTNAAIAPARSRGVILRIEAEVLSVIHHFRGTWMHRTLFQLSYASERGWRHIGLHFCSTRASRGTRQRRPTFPRMQFWRIVLPRLVFDCSSAHTNFPSHTFFLSLS